jgi:hypothetical protein
VDAAVSSSGFPAKAGSDAGLGIPSSDLESYSLIYLDLIRIDVVTWAADVGVPRGDQL